MHVTVDEIRAIIEKADTMVEMEQLKNDEPLSEQDIDSLDMANIFLLVEEEYGVKINDEDSRELKSVDAIVEYLGNK